MKLIIIKIKQGERQGGASRRSDGLVYLVGATVGIGCGMSRWVVDRMKVTDGDFEGDEIDRRGRDAAWCSGTRC